MGVAAPSQATRRSLADCDQLPAKLMTTSDEGTTPQAISVLRYRELQPSKTRRRRFMGSALHHADQCDDGVSGSGTHKTNWKQPLVAIAAYKTTLSTIGAGAVAVPIVKYDNHMCMQRCWAAATRAP